MNDFLVFEDGPSMGFNLQWATFMDASNESALSRMWEASTRRSTTHPADALASRSESMPFTTPRRLCSRSGPRNLGRRVLA